MRVPHSLINQCVKALSQSMDIGVMTALARRFIPHYDLHHQTGIPASVAIPNRNAAEQIIRDMIRNETFLEFVLLLVKTADQGLMGRRYAIPYLKGIINGVLNMGYLFDPENDMFVENPAEQRTRNWGTLRTGVNYTLTFLRLDIVGNSELVRRYSREQVDQAYNRLRGITVDAVEKRNGRIWGWDGDGGLAAFFYGKKNQSAALSGMEILHELFLYNNTCNPLKDPLVVRLAAHAGDFEYTPDPRALQTSDPVKRVIDIEHSRTEPDSLTLSEVVKVMLDGLLVNEFTEFRGSDHRLYYSYRLTHRRSS